MSADHGPIALSLVFPVFNEQENIDRLLGAALAWAPRVADRFEIIVVDDGSQDRSAERIARHGADDPRIRVVTHPANRGYGAALRSGLREARGRLVFFSDADCQFDLAELHRLLDHADRFDVVAGYRAPRRDPWPRRAIGATWSAIVRTLFGLQVRDIDCAFKVFRRPVLEAIEIESIGAFVNTEILVRAQNAGFRIHEIPVTHHPRGAGRNTGAHPRVIVRALLELAQLYRSLRRERPGRVVPNFLVTADRDPVTDEEKGHSSS